MSDFAQDINNAQKTLYMDFEKRQIPKKDWNRIESEFLNGFERGWKELESNPKQGLQFIVNLIGNFERYFEAGLAKDPSVFGYYMGYLTSAFRFCSADILRVGGNNILWLLKCLQILKRTTKCWHVIAESMMVWSREVEKNLKSLTKEEERLYGHLMGLASEQHPFFDEMYRIGIKKRK